MERCRWTIRATLISLRRAFFDLLILICAQRLDHDPGYTIAKPQLLYEISRHNDSWVVKVWRSFGPVASLYLLHAFPRKASRTIVGEKIHALSSHSNSIRYRFTLAIQTWRDDLGIIKWKFYSPLFPRWTIQCHTVTSHSRNRSKGRGRDWGRCLKIFVFQTKPYR
jgi:hypothetical protein